MQKAFQTGASIAVFGFTKYLEIGMQKPGNWNASLLPCFAESATRQHRSKHDQTEHRCECEVSQKINNEFTAYPAQFLSLITTIRQKKTKLGIENQFLPSSRQ
jgi:hypothetical protein